MIREVEIRFRILRDGARYGELFPASKSAPRVRASDSASIKMSLSGDFVVPDDINWLTDEIQPVLIVDGVESPIGIFAPATVTPTESETSRSVKVTAYDRCWRIRDTYAESTVYFAAGTNYITAIESLLTTAGVVIVVKTPTNATFPEAREDWEVGTSYLEIINELLSEISYNPLWFNSQGAAVLEPASVPTAENIEHVLDSDDVTSLLLPQISTETDIYSAPNVFLCVCSNADKTGALTATAENTNPQSPLSIMRRGRRIMKVVRVNNIASQTELNAYAERLRNESMFSGEIIKVTTALHAGYGVADVTALHYKDINAICIEHDWEMSLQVGGEMKHTLERVVANIE